jgi:hypothetical protein
LKSQTVSFLLILSLYEKLCASDLYADANIMRHLVLRKYSSYHERDTV